MKFIDETIIDVASGNGGAGSRSFRREKFVPMGGPDGGNGGRGGSVIVIADKNIQTLIDFKFKPLWRADHGKSGSGRRKDGLSGQDLVIKLPVGTEIFNNATQELVCDLTEEGQEVVIAKGGRGGKGNVFFKSATNQAPTHAQAGEPGENFRFKLNLKLVADVGIVGFPNAGKSTLISKVSAAKPKISDYPFTTLTPNLGVVQGKFRNFVIADIPGLIPGASEGKGLGFKFLKHVERTKVLLFLVDPFALDEHGEQISAWDNYNQLSHELTNFSEWMESKKKIIAISKSETIAQEEERTAIEQIFKDNNQEVHFISSLTAEGLPDLLLNIEKILA